MVKGVIPHPPMWNGLMMGPNNYIGRKQTNLFGRVKERKK
jgi:hypothetical protein